VSTNEKSVRITSAERYKIFVSSDKVCNTMARIQSQTLAEALQVTIFPENVGFGNMRIITLISMVS